MLFGYPCTYFYCLSHRLEKEIDRVHVKPDALTIPRARLIEVDYVLRISLGVSALTGTTEAVYVMLPLRIVNPVSLDPPPFEPHSVKRRMADVIGLDTPRPGDRTTSSGSVLKGPRPPRPNRKPRYEEDDCGDQNSFSNTKSPEIPGSATRLGLQTAYHRDTTSQSASSCTKSIDDAMQDRSQPPASISTASLPASTTALESLNFPSLLHTSSPSPPYINQRDVHAELIGNDLGAMESADDLQCVLGNFGLSGSESILEETEVLCGEMLDEGVGQVSDSGFSEGDEENVDLEKVMGRMPEHWDGHDNDEDGQYRNRNVDGDDYHTSDHEHETPSLTRSRIPLSPPLVSGSRIRGPRSIPKPITRHQRIGSEGHKPVDMPSSKSIPRSTKPTGALGTSAVREQSSASRGSVNIISNHSHPSNHPNNYHYAHLQPGCPMRPSDDENDDDSDTNEVTKRPVPPPRLPSLLGVQYGEGQAMPQGWTYPDPDVRSGDRVRNGFLSMGTVSGNGASEGRHDEGMAAMTANICRGRGIDRKWDTDRFTGDATPESTTASTIRCTRSRSGSPSKVMARVALFEQRVQEENEMV
jgi:hypothetical protein